MNQNSQRNICRLLVKRQLYGGSNHPKLRCMASIRDECTTVWPASFSASSGKQTLFFSLLNCWKTKYSLHMKKRCNYMACTDPFKSFVWPIGVAFIRPLLFGLYRSVHICCVVCRCSYYTASQFLLDALWSSPCPLW